MKLSWLASIVDKIPQQHRLFYSALILVVVVFSLSIVPIVNSFTTIYTAELDSAFDVPATVAASQSQDADSVKVIADILVKTQDDLTTAEIKIEQLSSQVAAQKLDIERLESEIMILIALCQENEDDKSQ
jgi:hypothetical protein